MTSCPYVPPVFLAPFTLPLMKLLARYFPDRSLREARPRAPRLRHDRHLFHIRLHQAPFCVVSCE